MSRNETAPIDTPHAYAPVKAEDAKPDVHITRDGTTHEVETIEGHRVHYDYQADKTTRVAGDWPEAANAHVRDLISDAISDREARENIRANKRNFNRMLTLVGALVIGLVVTYSLTNGWFGAWGKVLAPYSFVITVLLDTSLAAYSYIKHY